MKYTPRGLFQQRHVCTCKEPYKRDAYAYEWKWKPVKYLKRDLLRKRDEYGK